MLFSLGPVMRYELITTSRRRRYYVLKVVYGLVLLAQLWMLFRDWDVQHQSGDAYRVPPLRIWTEQARRDSGICGRRIHPVRRRSRAGGFYC